jgi:hypothetical protein
VVTLLPGLRFDPLPPLLGSSNEAVRYFARRDLLNEQATPVETLWQLEPVRKLLRKQREDGSWSYPGGGRAHLRSREDYAQLQTYRTLAELVEKYGLDRRSPAARRAAEFLFACQTDEGDFRGIYGDQYTPNYSGAILEVLINAGYEDDERIERAFLWLLSVRQQDGGWAIPLRTHGRKFDAGTLRGDTLPPDVTRPFSHLVTGVVLRAFAAHPTYRQAPEARAAAGLLASRFFARDVYPDRSAAGFWTSFTYPFSFTDLLSALDSLSLLGFTIAEKPIGRAVRWFVDQQDEDGLWRLRLLAMTGEKDRDLWITLVICRVLERLSI